MPTTTNPTIAAYIDCALWAGLDWTTGGDHNPPLDESYGAADLAPEALAEIIADVEAFTADNAADLADLDAAQVGHDFYLTRNGHGAGFWDRGLGDVGERLTQAAKVYGTSELYPGDDGRLYLSH